MRVLVTGGSGFIGTNLVAFMAGQGHEVMNLDIQPPRIDAQQKNWHEIDVRDSRALRRTFETFLPNQIVHLAAVATFEASIETLRLCNVDGTANVLDAALDCAPLQRVIVASSQYVNGPGAPFDDDLCFHPVNDYGESKALAERLMRQERFSRLDWAIVRPTNIWGPYHPRFPDEIWRYIKRGMYLHPGYRPIVRAYGYVENIVRQIDIILRAPVDRIRHRVFYLTDPPMDSFEFLNGFSLALRMRPLRRVPYPLLRCLAVVGDALKAVGLQAPLFSDRLSRMRSEHSSRYEPLWAEFGYQPVALPEAVSRTVSWLNEAYPEHYR